MKPTKKALAALEADMRRALAAVLGHVHCKESAAEFVQIAENYAAMEVQRAKKAAKARAKRKAAK